MSNWAVVHGDCREVLRNIGESNEFNAIVTDPPYGLSFMGKGWDHAVPGAEFWAEFLRVAKPGAPLLAFGGTRTFHRLACAIEDAGWELRDCLSWLYGTGYPKSVSVLKPAWEPIILARKPLDGTVAANALKHGACGLTPGACRIGTEKRHNPPVGAHRNSMMPYEGKDGPGTDVEGRWPANVMLDEEVAEVLDIQTGGASRFFYVAKASKRERTNNGQVENTHPTVKPVELMRWLVRLVGPGLILDPFCGSGSTGIAARLEGCDFFGIEQDDNNAQIASKRIALVEVQ